jgi:hypothetical protein
MVDIVRIGRNWQRADVQGRRHAGRNRETGAEIIMSRLRVSSAEDVVVLDPRNIDGAKEGRRQESDRGKTDDGPNFAVSLENRLA